MRNVVAILAFVASPGPNVMAGQEVKAEYRSEQDQAVSAWLTENLDGLVTTYKHLHAHPELSLAEHQTAALVAEEFTRCGYSVTTGVGGTGVVGVLANGSGPTILVRGDMDALP
ncbi:MAG: hypothetical protein ACYSUI_14625, partial [Planctomycetota bacterium]